MRLAIGFIILISIIIIGSVESNAIIMKKMSKTVSSTGLSVNDSPVDSFTLGGNIRVIFQDKKGSMWFGTEGNGAFKYDGKKYTHYTRENGLVGQFIRTINQDNSGNIWFGTDLGIYSYNGMFFVDYTKNKNSGYHSTSCSFVDKNGELWFGSKDGVYKFDGQKLNLIALPISEVDKQTCSTQYSVYSINEDNNGNYYFGTELRGVCKYNGTTFEYITDKDLDKGAVRIVYKDKKGIMWFGNNGAGLYSYDGNTLRNISTEKGLNNPNFGKTRLMGAPGTMARVWSIAEDIAGNLWVGTIDAGAWRFDGVKMTNITIKDGLPNNGVQSILKDTHGKLWFGTNQGGVSTFNGSEFQVVVKVQDGC